MIKKIETDFKHLQQRAVAQNPLVVSKLETLKMIKTLKTKKAGDRNEWSVSLSYFVPISLQKFGFQSPF